MFEDVGEASLEVEGLYSGGVREGIFQLTELDSADIARAVELTGGFDMVGNSNGESSRKTGQDLDVDEPGSQVASTIRRLRPEAPITATPCCLRFPAPPPTLSSPRVHILVSFVHPTLSFLRLYCFTLRRSRSARHELAALSTGS